MNMEVQDLHRVVRVASRHGRNVAMGGHWLGGTITTAYATWDFKGAAGADALSGLVLIDGASRTTPISPEDAQSALDDLQNNTPWLAFGGSRRRLPACSAWSARRSPSSTRMGPRSWRPGRFCRPFLKEPGAGHEQGRLRVLHGRRDLAALAGRCSGPRRSPRRSGDPRGWDRDGAITPLKRWAAMFSGWGLNGVDGTAWYHPMRLTLDGGAVGNGIANPAQDVLNVHATHGTDLPRELRIYAFGAALGGDRVPAAAEALAEQSGIPRVEPDPRRPRQHLRP